MLVAPRASRAGGCERPAHRGAAAPPESFATPHASTRNASRALLRARARTVIAEDAA